MQTQDFENRESDDTDANLVGTLADGPPWADTAQIIPFRRALAAALSGSVGTGGATSSLSDLHFESFGDLTHAVVMRLRGDLPRITVMARHREAEADHDY